MQSPTDPADRTGTIGVEAFDATYGAGFQAPDDSPHAVECELVENGGTFAAHRPSGGDRPRRIAFVDGTMRTEARLTPHRPRRRGQRGSSGQLGGGVSPASCGGRTGCTDHFKAGGRGWHTRIDAALREWIDHDRSARRESAPIATAHVTLQSPSRGCSRETGQAQRRGVHQPRGCTSPMQPGLLRPAGAPRPATPAQSG